jgi:succinylglutamic semialdehyde dehydrogenase
MNVLGNYVGGEFGPPFQADAGELVSRSPADLSDEIGRFPTSVADVDKAVGAARAAFRAWSVLPQVERNAAILRLRAELLAREAAFVEVISREVGKPRWEARTELKAMVGKADVTLNEGLRFIAPFTPDSLNGECRFRPHGVLAVIGPFNFPGHLPNGHIMPALAAGNTVVFKPSELTPGVGQLYTEAVHASGFPAGVFNLVQGGRSIGERISIAPGIDGILFTGSQGVGSAIQRVNADRPGKILALELGGKNCSVVLEDADFDKAVYDVLFSAYVTTGQRCSATSRAIVHASLVDRFTDRMATLVGKLKVGHPAKDDTFMGPLISETARAKFLEGCARAKSEGAQAIIEPRAYELPEGPLGYYVRPGLHRVTEVRADSAYQREELFGPDLAIYSFQEPEEAIALANAVDYGLTAAVFTGDRLKFDALANRIEAGVINWNAPTVGSSSRLPFGGIKRSGNHRPAGLFSTLYCAYPIAITRGEATLDRRTLAPGVVWD